MRELVIGDIHGCSEALTTLLKDVKPQPEDTLIFLGDYIDRGPDSYAVIETIMEWNRRCTVIALAGNHEEMLLRARADRRAISDWMTYGGTSTLESYQRRSTASGFEVIPEHHWKFFGEQTLKYWENDQYIFVHGALYPDLELAEQPDSVLLWERFTDPMVHISGKQVVCGHTSQQNGVPALFDGGVCIDTCVYGNTGWLTCYDLARGSFVQANQRGHLRDFNLEMLQSRRDFR
jgi:serine/threonine protein phosphatase 1